MLIFLGTVITRIEKRCLFMRSKPRHTTFVVVCLIATEVLKLCIIVFLKPLFTPVKTFVKLDVQDGQRYFFRFVEYQLYHRTQLPPCTVQHLSTAKKVQVQEVGKMQGLREIQKPSTRTRLSSLRRRTVV